MLPESLIDGIKSFYNERFPAKPFLPGDSPVPPSGKMFDATELINVTEAALDGWWTEGRFTRAFEERFSKQLGRAFCITTNSGSSANLLALSALTSKKLGSRRLKPGDEVITVAAGFPTTITPIIQNKCVPVFVDIDPTNYNIDLDKLRNAITHKTRAVMIAHTLGNPFPAAEVVAICRERGLWLVEDACDALGSFYGGRPTGTFGDISTFSFYPAHHITMGEGGALATDDAILSKAIRSFRDWGRDCWCAPGTDNTCGIRFGWQLGTLPKGYDHKYIYSEAGYNLKLTDMQAALGLAQLDKLSSFGEARRHNHALLRKGLAPLEKFFRLPDPTPKSDPSWFGFLITVKQDAPFTRDAVVQFLNGRKIGTRYLFAGNMTRQPVFSDGDIPFRVAGELTATDDVMLNTFWIGCHPNLSKVQLEYVISSFHEFCAPFTSAGQAHQNALLPTHLSIVIPAYNEGHHLESVIRRIHGTLRASGPSFEIVLVNNGSTDNTSEVAQILSRELSEVRVVDVRQNLGYGNGVLRGLAEARGEVLGWMHADEQATPEHLLEIYRVLKERGLDVSRAVRIHRHESLWRVFQSKAYNFLFRTMFNMPFNDINGTPKLMTRAFYEKARLCSKEWFIDPEVMIKAGRSGAKVGDVEIIWNARKSGKSKVHLATMFRFMKHMINERLRKDV